LSTKIHTLADQATATVAIRLTGGQAGDNPQLMPLLDDYRQAGRSWAFRLLADKAYSHPSTRNRLRHRKIAHTIPEKSDQIARRKAKGSRGGRPPAFDAEVYKKRNTVERSYLRLKQWRGVATRYDKHARTFLGGVLLAASILYIKTH
jgi:transposase